jgi:hypothetical protein
VTWTADFAYYALGRGQLDLASSTSLYMGLYLVGSGLSGSGQPSASDRSQNTNISECNYANYALTNITGVTLTLDTTAHTARWKFSPVTFTNLGTSVGTQVGGAWIQLHASTTTGHILAAFDTSPLFPFSGGGDKVIVPPVTGAIRLRG